MNGEKTMQDLRAEELYENESMNELFRKLDIVFESEKVYEGYNAHSKFITYQKCSIFA